MSNPSRRRSRRAGSVLIAVCAMFAVAACGSDEDSGAEGTSADTATTDAVTDTTGTTDAAADTTFGAAAVDGTFPVSIENMFGTTVIESKPERVVSIGYTDGDYVLALGVT